MSAKTLISAVEFDRLEAPEDVRYELDEGELIAMTRPRYRPHNRTVMRLTGPMLAYLAENPVGEVLNSDNLYVLGPATRRAPDLSFIRTERLAQIGENEDIPGAPDLAIEVVSPSDTVEASRKKIRQYFEAGCLLVWQFYPATREVAVWDSPAGPKVILSENEFLTAPDLLPGFSVKVGDLF